MNKNSKWMAGAGILLTACAAVAAYFINKKNRDTDKPPKNAPQLEIDNPGTQAEFPTSATESEVG